MSRLCHDSVTNTYHQRKRPPIGTPHRPITRHLRKGSPRAKSHNIIQHSSRACLQQRNVPPSSRTTTRFFARSSGRRHYNTNTTSSDPRLGGPLSERTDGQPRTNGLPLWGRRKRGQGEGDGVGRMSEQVVG